MRTLTILFAVLLLVLQTPAEPLGERATELPSQEQPEAQDQDTAISFAGDESSTRGAAGPQQRAICYCRPGCCNLRELHSGTCTINGKYHTLCCR